MNFKLITVPVKSWDTQAKRKPSLRFSHLDVSSRTFNPNVAQESPIYNNKTQDFFGLAVILLLTRLSSLTTRTVSFSMNNLSQS